MDYEAKTHELLKRAAYLVVAVVASDGRAWAVPVHKYAYEKGVISWQSLPETIHSRAIAADPRVSITVFDDHDGFYAHANVQAESSEGDNTYLVYHAAFEDAFCYGEDRQKHDLDLSKLAALDN